MLDTEKCHLKFSLYFQNLTSEKIIARKVLGSVECEKFTLSWLTGHIFEIAIKDRAFLDVDDIREIQIHKAKLTNNKKHGVLFITPGFGSLTKEAREYSASPAASENAIAKAIITSNLGMKIMANFFIVFNKPGVPHRTFSELNEGFTWLVEEMGKMSRK